MREGKEPNEHSAHLGRKIKRKLVLMVLGARNMSSSSQELGQGPKSYRSNEWNNAEKSWGGICIANRSLGTWQHLYFYSVFKLVSVLGGESSAKLCRPFLSTPQFDLTLNSDLTQPHSWLN